jgi:hypothetical protein
VQSRKTKLLLFAQSLFTQPDPSEKAGAHPDFREDAEATTTIKAIA